MLQTSTATKVNERDLPRTRRWSSRTPDEQRDAEVLKFLAQRPIHTITMMSLIHDNGIVSPFNRGTFYGCRD